MKLRTLILDDERVARQRLRRLLSQDPEVEIVCDCADGQSALNCIREEAPDLLLLDIQMPGIDGFDLLRALDPKREPVVVFVTAFDRHAVRAFDACALDYLLKPVSAERLATALARVRSHLQSFAQSGGRTSAPNASGPGALRFQVRCGQRTSFIAAEEIDWIEADGNYAVLHVGAQNHLLRETMSALESRLKAAQYLRVSRSAIVNLQRARDLFTDGKGRHFLVMVDDQRVPFSLRVREMQEHLRSVKP